MKRVDINTEQLSRLLRVTNITHSDFVSGCLSKVDCMNIERALKFIKVDSYEKSRYRKRAKVC